MQYTPIHSNLDIDARVMSISMAINKHHTENPMNTVMVCALPNGYRFFSDCMKYIAFNVTTDFCVVSEYVDDGGWYTVNRHGTKELSWHDSINSNARIYIFIDEIDNTEKCLELVKYYRYHFTPSEIHLFGMLRRQLVDGYRLEEICDSVKQLFLIDESEYCGNGIPDSEGGHSTPPTIYRID